MDSPARRRVDEVLDRIFPGDEPAVPPADGNRSPQTRADGSVTAAVSGVDARRQRMLEPLGDPDREAW